MEEACSHIAAILTCVVTAKESWQKSGADSSTSTNVFGFLPLLI